MSRKNRRKANTQHEPQAAKQEAIVYIGPNLLRHGITQFQVFRSGIPAHIAPLTEKVPEIQSLFVPVAELAQARKELASPGSRHARNFSAVRKALLK